MKESAAESGESEATRPSLAAPDWGIIAGFVKLPMKKKEATRPSLASPEFGIDAQNWFYGAAKGMKDNAPTVNEIDSSSIKDTASVDGEAAARAILTKDPTINASTFFNTLIAQGIGFIKTTKPQEADNSTANTQFMRQSSKPKMKFLCSFIERAASDDGIGHTKFSVILLQEGLGNLKDAFYYSKEALDSAIPIFEGKKIYADHPSSTDEQSRPERSVRDVLGHFQNIHVESDDKGRAQLCGEVCILGDKEYEWARGLMRHSVEYSKKYPDKDFIGLSINAAGDAEERDIDSLIESSPESAQLKLINAKKEGLTSVRYVTQIADAVSCDMVTEAGAGGRIINFL